MIVDEVLEAPSLLSWFFFLSCRRRFITCFIVSMKCYIHTTYQQYLHIKLVPGLAPLSLAFAVLAASDDFAWPEDSLRILASYIKGPWKARTFSLAKKRPSLIFLTCWSCSCSPALGFMVVLRYCCSQNSCVQHVLEGCRTCLVEKQLRVWKVKTDF